jgi:hypothetical protein
MVTKNRIAAISTLLATLIFISFSHVVQYGFAAPKQNFSVDIGRMAFESQKHLPFTGDSGASSSIANLQGDSQSAWTSGDYTPKLGGEQYLWHHHNDGKASNSIVNIQKDECSSTSLANGGTGNGGNGGPSNGGNGGTTNGGNGGSVGNDGGTGGNGSSGGFSGGGGGGPTLGAPGTGGPSNAASQTACSNKSTFN